MILFHFEHNLVESEVKMPSFETEELLLNTNTNYDGF